MIEILLLTLFWLFYTASATWLLVEMREFLDELDFTDIIAIAIPFFNLVVAIDLHSKNKMFREYKKESTKGIPSPPNEYYEKLLADLEAQNSSYVTQKEMDKWKQKERESWTN